MVPPPARDLEVSPRISLPPEAEALHERIDLGFDGWDIGLQAVEPEHAKRMAHRELEGLGHVPLPRERQNERLAR